MAEEETYDVDRKTSQNFPRQALVIPEMGYDP